MLTRLVVRNFKRFESVDIELGEAVVLIGPNNSGKTSALQALALWELGVRRWSDRRSGDEAPEKRPGVAINRRDLISVPVPDAELLWRNRRVQDTETVEGKRRTEKIRIDVVVEGITEDQPWRCGFEFDYANEESLYCRPLRLSDDRKADRMAVPPAAARVRMAYLPPLSGLAANETRLDPGAIDVRIGEGRTAEVLRNLCYRIATERAARDEWQTLVDRVHAQFRVTLDEPRYIAERGEIAMTYRDAGGARLDLSSAGRGLQQTLLLLAYLQANPGAVLLLDEPDAHLEILRQRQSYQLLTTVAREQGSQVIAASHCEVVLGEAAGRDVIAFVGNPHRVGDRTSQVLKALKDIPFDHYYQAEQQGWVLYLEGSTDLAILQAFASEMNHPAAAILERPFVHYVANHPPAARHHFFGLREARADLTGVAVFDRMDATPGDRRAARGDDVAPSRARELPVLPRSAGCLCRGRRRERRSGAALCRGGTRQAAAGDAGVRRGSRTSDRSSRP